MKKLVIYLVTIFAAVTALGQNVGGSLRGSLQDATGARIADATIVVRAPMEAERRSVRSDNRGSFRIDDLAPGNYRVVAIAPGFADAAADVVVNVSTILDITDNLAACPGAGSCRRSRAGIVNRHPAHRSCQPDPPEQ